MNRKNKKKRQSFKKKIGGIVFLLLIAGMAYFLLFSSVFQINKIDISVPDFVSENDVREIVQQNLNKKTALFISQKNIIVLPTEKIEADILKLSTEISLVLVKNKINTLNVEVLERQNVGIWCQISNEQRTMNNEQETKNKEQNGDEFASATGSFAGAQDDKRLDSRFSARGGPASGTRLGNDNEALKSKVKQCFNIDNNGAIYKISPQINSSLILTIYDARYDFDAQIGDDVVLPETIQFITETNHLLKNDDINVEKFEIKSENDLLISTVEGWDIYFDAKQSIESQISSLNIVLNELIKDTRSTLEYIDLRIEGRAYYK